MEPVSYSVDAGAGVITLGDPEAGNRLNSTMLESLERHLTTAVADDSVRAVVLRSSGATFCLGMDLDALLAGDISIGPTPAATPSNVPVPDPFASAAADASRPVAIPALETAVRRYGTILQLLSSCPKPTVALVQGAVKAGGVGLTSACDIVLADENATFELSEVLLGLIPANVLPYLVAWRCTPHRARYLVLTARRVDADEAVAFGLAEEAFPTDAFEKSVRGVLKQLLRANPAAIDASKRFTRELARAEREEGIERAVSELVRLIQLPEVRDGIAAFSEGDLPPWFAPYKPAGKLGISGNAEDSVP